MNFTISLAKSEAGTIPGLIYCRIYLVQIQSIVAAAATVGVVLHNLCSKFLISPTAMPKKTPAAFGRGFRLNNEVDFNSTLNHP